MVADPDPDHADPLQVSVSLLEQVAHQLVQATLDRHLGSRRGVLCQGLDEGCGSPVPCHRQLVLLFLQAEKEEERARGTRARLRATLGRGLDTSSSADQLSHWPQSYTSVLSRLWGQPGG